MTGQDLLDRMELVNQELQLQPGEGDVTRGLLALNVAQDYFESLAAARKDFKGAGTGTVTTVTATETTTFPSGLLRVDAIDLLDPVTLLPKRRLVPIQETGGHALTSTWPADVTTGTRGEPRGWWTNGNAIYWNPLPNATHTLRWYGFSKRTVITAGATFVYDDIVAFPLAAFAVRLLRIGLDDPASDPASLAQEMFKSTLDILGTFNRASPKGFIYTRSHTE